MVATVPVLAALSAVLFPGMSRHVLLASPQALAAVQSAIQGRGGGVIAVFAVRGSTLATDDLYTTGTLARVVNLGTRSSCRRPVAVLVGERRVRLLEGVQQEPFREARVELLHNEGPSVLLDELDVAVRTAVLKLYAGRSRCRPSRRARDAVDASATEHLPGVVADLLAHRPVELRQQLLETERLGDRLQLALALVHGLQAGDDDDRR